MEKKYQYEDSKEIIIRIWAHEGKVETWTQPLYWRFDRFFDGKGNLIKEECHFNQLESKNVLQSYDTFKYNEENIIKRYVSYGENMKPQIIHEYFYK